MVLRQHARHFLLLSRLFVEKNGVQPEPESQHGEMGRRKLWPRIQYSGGNENCDA